MALQIRQFIENSLLDLALNCRQIVNIPMGINCAPLVADLLFAFCVFDRFHVILSDENLADGDD